MVNDDCWGKSTEASFKEAFFAHTSTSPKSTTNSLPRRGPADKQELEGYELVGRSIELSLILRREVNKHPLISKYFRIATNAQMVPARAPLPSGFEDFHADGVELENHL